MQQQYVQLCVDDLGRRINNELKLRECCRRRTAVKCEAGYIRVRVTSCHRFPEGNPADARHMGYVLLPYTFGKEKRGGALLS